MPRRNPIALGDIALHAARVAVFATALFVAAPRSLVCGAVASAALFFAAFALAHDLAHGALRLPRRVNAIALSAAAMGMLVSGHAMRIMHLRHHARPLADDDVEGEGARLSMLQAIAMGPRNAVALRVAAFRASRGRVRAWQIGESTFALALVLSSAAIGARALLVHVAVCVALQLTMNVWASHIPHHAPRWLTRFAERLAFTRSPLFLSLAFHDLHHERPAIPCQQLGR